MRKSKAIVLVNLGTPEEPTPSAVGVYLKEFLMDRWVVDIPALWRWVLVHLLIVPKRKYDSAEAYKKIWWPEGSPLRVISERLAVRVQDQVDSNTLVLTAMRYGTPSLNEAFRQIQEQGIESVTVVPLYPQYAESSTRTCHEACVRVITKLRYQGRVEYLAPFYDRAPFLDSYAHVARPLLSSFAPDHVLMSFHGLPERHVRRTDATGQHCLQKSNCCDSVTMANRWCYRAHCFATARGLATRLGLGSDHYSVAFQSRLGRTPWIQPFTDERYHELVNQGVKKLAVMCPSFTADCLETLEEIADRGREEFLKAGGQDFILIPCLNDDPFWAKNLVRLIQDRGQA